METMTTEDMISEVPQDIMGRILEQMPVQDAVRTSVLAHNWKSKWASISKLTFGKEFFKYIEMEKSLPRPLFFQTIHNLLLHQQNNLESFTLYVPISETKDLSPVTDILHLVSERSVKVLAICYERLLEKYEEDDYKVLTPLYSCSEMNSLELTNCGFFRPPSFNGFSNLVSLHCNQVNFCNDSFGYLISSCPLIETLILVKCSSPVTFHICSTRLKHLEVSIASESLTIIDAPNLEILFLCSRDDDVDNYGPVMFMTKLDSLKELWFHLLYLHVFDDISLLFKLLYAAPNLQLLDVTTCRDTHTADIMNCLKANMNQKLEKLETLNLHIWNGSDEEMFIVERLLALSPALKKVWVDLDLDDTSRTPALTDKIIKFGRASPVVELTFEECEWEVVQDF